MDEIDRFATPNQNAVRCREVFRNGEGKLACRLHLPYDRKKCTDGELYCEDRVTK